MTWLPRDLLLSQGRLLTYFPQLYSDEGCLGADYMEQFQQFFCDYIKLYGHF